MFAAKDFRRPLALGRAALFLTLALLGAGASAGGNPDATMTVVSDPNPALGQWATVSRDATATVGPSDYYIAYNVSITNPTNSSKNFRFVGNVTVSGAGAIAPTQFVSSRPDCTWNAVTSQITCPKLEVAKLNTVKFSVRFRTPTGGTAMQLGANLYFPVTSTTVAVSSSTSIELKEQELADYRLGFYTYVPTTGGTFCTGDNGNGGQNNPGCVAKSGDPITTTIVIANGSIAAPTTARVLESTEAVCASSNFTACYDSSLTIPDTAFNPPLKVYLRIDKSKLYLPTSLNSIQVFYEDHVDPVPQCTGNLPQPGQPCWQERGFYPPGFEPAEFQFDFYVVILARNNGTYRLR